MPRVVGLGEILWDILPDGSRHLGGAPMNVAVHAQALGCTAAVISAVGDDELGREAIELLTKEHRLDVAAVQILADRPTGAVDVRLKDGQPTYEFRADVAWDFLLATVRARETAQAADAVVFGTLAQRNAVSRSTVCELLEITPADCLRVFDVNLRPPFFSELIIRESIAKANVLKLNDAELPAVLSAIGIESCPGWTGRLFAMIPQLRVVALTRGGEGSAVFTPERLDGHTLPARQVVVKDTVGAGDAFTAALIAGMLRGRGLEAIHHHAVAAAAFVCSRSGATPALPASLVESVTRD
ncbi:MAG: carbohydrate kinase [Pirellulales bacterium]